MDEAEHLVARAGYDRVGLSVALHNVRARAVYERRGYAGAGAGEYQSRWPYLDETGQEQWQEETCVYLVKDLRC
jgi:ribosomal protein S18 acetylase RimI-like enzyme